MKQTLLFLALILMLLQSCSKHSAGTSTAVKPIYHHSWYKKSSYKKNWHIGRIRFRMERQGVKKVKMKN